MLYTLGKNHRKEAEGADEKLICGLGIVNGDRVVDLQRRINMYQYLYMYVCDVIYTVIFCRPEPREPTNS